MREQLQLLRETDWDALLVLDACRADCFREVCLKGAETVRSPGVCTAQWIAAAGPTLLERGALYFSANPVVDREVARRGLDLELVSVWDRHWGRFTRHRVPSVHPMSVNGVVLTHEEMGLLKGRPAVVHYLQPHSPYIGEAPLAMARWGRSRHEFGRACHALPRPDSAARRGKLNWEVLRRAYGANLRLAWNAALMLARSLSGRVVVTADHGELLGEDGRFGHEGHWRHDALLQVPWLELKAQSESPQAEGNGMKRKLEALGYA